MFGGMIEPLVAGKIVKGLRGVGASLYAKT